MAAMRAASVYAAAMRLACRSAEMSRTRVCLPLGAAGRAFSQSLPAAAVVAPVLQQAAGAAGTAVASVPSSISASPDGGAAGRLVTYPHPALRAKCSEVADVRDPDVQATIAHLIALVKEHDALGAAAPQIGVTRRIFVTRRPLYYNEADYAAKTRNMKKVVAAMAAAGGHPPREYDVYVNPSIGGWSEGTALGCEGCLSIPDYPALVRRHNRVDVAWTDADTGERRTRRLEGLPAICFQHELDHLDGVLETDREVTVFPKGRSRDEEMSLAVSRFNLHIMKWFGETQLM